MPHTGLEDDLGFASESDFLVILLPVSFFSFPSFWDCIWRSEGSLDFSGCHLLCCFWFSVPYPSYLCRGTKIKVAEPQKARFSNFDFRGRFIVLFGR